MNTRQVYQKVQIRRFTHAFCLHPKLRDQIMRLAVTYRWKVPLHTLQLDVTWVDFVVGNCRPGYNRNG
jgi:hypothetical protein